jgi:regulator of sigma D
MHNESYIWNNIFYKHFMWQIVLVDSWKDERKQTEMVLACYEVIGNKSSKSSYENERRRKKRKKKTKKDKVGYD